MAYTRLNLSELNFNNPSNIFYDSVFDSRDQIKNIDYYDSSADANYGSSSSLKNIWRYYLGNTSLTEAQRSALFIRNTSTYHSGSGSLELKVSGTTGSSTLNTTPLLNMRFMDQWAWNHFSHHKAGTVTAGYDFYFRSPGTAKDSIVFSYGTFSRGINTTNTLFELSDLMIFISNGIFYCLVESYESSSKNISFITKLTDTTTANTWINFRVGEFIESGTKKFGVFVNDIKKVEISLFLSTGGYSSNQENISYNINDHTIQSTSGVGNALSTPYALIGSGGKGLILNGANGSSITNNTITKKVVLSNLGVEGSSSIKYLADPLPAGNYTYTFTVNDGDSLIYDDIKTYAYFPATELNSDFSTSITVEPPQVSFDLDVLNPISISVKEDIEEDLFSIDIDAAKDLDIDFSTSIDVKKDVYYEKLPITVKVEWEKYLKDILDIEVTANAPVYHLELGPEFRSGWDDRKYLIFRNGCLMPKQTYNIIIPSPFNNYLKKVIYSTVPFWKEDRIEVFYIENQQNFANVPFNRETRVASYIYYARSENQKLIKIPYPNSSYRRSKDAFILFNDQGEHLDFRYDYTVSADGRYVTLSDANKLVDTMINYVVFTFCYVGNRSINGQEKDLDPDDTTQLSEIKYTYSYSLDNPTNTSGLVTFSPVFSDWPNMIKENFMLFGNTTFIDQSRYNVVSNNQIQFVDPSEKLIANQRRYVMCIPVKDTKPQKLASNQTRYEIVLIPNNGTTDKSELILQPPTGSGEWYPYLIFRGSRLMDVKNEYTYDDVTNILTITHPSCYLQPGRNLTVVYSNKSYTDLKKENRYIKMQFRASSTGITEIPKSMYHNSSIQFDHTNLILFLNGVYLEPDRYTIEPGNWIKFNPNISIAGYGPAPYENKMFTAVYLMEYEDTDSNYEEFNDIYGQKEVDPSEDNDETRFEEVYAYVKKKP